MRGRKPYRADYLASVVDRVGFICLTLLVVVLILAGAIRSKLRDQPANDRQPPGLPGPNILGW